MALTDNYHCGFETGGLEELSSAGGGSVDAGARTGGNGDYYLGGVSNGWCEISPFVTGEGGIASAGDNFIYTFWARSAQTAVDDAAGFVTVFGTGGGQIVALVFDATNNRFNVEDNTATTIGNTGTDSFPDDETWRRVDIIHSTSASAGYIEIWIDGVSKFSTVAADTDDGGGGSPRIFRMYMGTGVDTAWWDFDDIRVRSGGGQDRPPDYSCVAFYSPLGTETGDALSSGTMDATQEVPGSAAPGATFNNSAGASDGEETLYPTALEASANYTGAVIGDFDDDPDTTTDYGDWDGNGNTDVRVSFGNPSGQQLKTGAGLQEFRIAGRKADATGGNTLTYDVELWEAGILNTVLVSGASWPDDTGKTIISVTWDASLLSNQTGDDVELRIEQTDGGGGSPGSRRGLEIGGIEWNVDYTTPLAPPDVQRTIDADSNGNPGFTGSGLVGSINHIKGYWRARTSVSADTDPDFQYGYYGNDVDGVTGVALSLTASPSNTFRHSTSASIVPTSAESARMGFGQDNTASATDHETLDLYETLMLVLFEPAVGRFPYEAVEMQKRDMRTLMMI